MARVHETIFLSRELEGNPPDSMPGMHRVRQVPLAHEAAAVRIDGLAGFKLDHAPIAFTTIRT
jgi:hypothetical protein